MCRISVCVIPILLAAMGCPAEGADSLKQAESATTMPRAPRPTPHAAHFFFAGDTYAARTAPREDAAQSGWVLRENEEVSFEHRAVDDDGVVWLGVDHEGATRWMPEALVARVPAQNIRAGDLPIGEEQVDRWRALPLDYEPPDLVALPQSISYYPSRTCLMREEAAARTVALIEAAREEGLELRAVSTYRSAATQRDVYLRKIASAGYRQKSVAKPGHSEHQLGTALDINGLDDATVVEPEFGDTAEGKWVARNAARFGFVLSYTAENTEQTGYEPEPWHLRYVGVDKAAQWKPLGRPPEMH